MKHLTRFVLAAALCAVSLPAIAQSSPVLVAAREAGLVGERYDGYMGYTGAASSDARRQVGAVNITRRSLYSGLATRRRATVQEVGIAAGCQLLAEVKPGESYMLNDGVWRKRAVGAPAPVPVYCTR